MMISGKSALRKNRFTSVVRRVAPCFFGTQGALPVPRYGRIASYVAFGTRSGCRTATYGRFSAGEPMVPRGPPPPAQCRALVPAGLRGSESRFGPVSCPHADTPAGLELGCRD